MRLKNAIKNIPVLAPLARWGWRLLRGPSDIARLQERLGYLEREGIQDERYEEVKFRAVCLARDLEVLKEALGEQAKTLDDRAVKGLAAREPSIDSHFYLAFENSFRGPQGSVMRNQSQYLPDILKAAKESSGHYVLDVGCGRGEFLKLVDSGGVPAKGVDNSKAMVDACKGNGVEAVLGDTLEYLFSVPDGALIGLTAFQVVEHVPSDYLVELVKTAYFKTAPGGVIILETVNSDSLFSLRNFYLDMTHRNPIPANTLQFLVDYVGYRNVGVRYSSPIPREIQLEGKDRNVKKLNRLLFGPQDYAVIGWR